MAGTLDDVAALSGVSRSTVSRAINGGSVSEATRRRVVAAMEADRLSAQPGGANAGLGAFRRRGRGHPRTARPALPGRLLLGPLPRHRRGPRPAQRRHDALARQPLQGADPRAHPGHAPVRRPHRHRGHARRPARRWPHPLQRCRPCSWDTATRTARRATWTSTTSAPPSRSPTTSSALGRTRVGHVTGRRGGVSAEERLTGYRRAMERAHLACRRPRRRRATT